MQLDQGSNVSSPVIENDGVYETAIIEEYRKSNTPITILLVDDEHLYLTVLRNQITSKSELARGLTIDSAMSGEEAITLSSQKKYDLIIMDLDMGKNKLNGFETTKILRSGGSKSMICIHSNRTGTQSYREAMDSGAGYFIGKTMPREHFLKLIFSVRHQSSPNGVLN